MSRLKLRLFCMLVIQVIIQYCGNVMAQKPDARKREQAGISFMPDR